MQTRRCVMECWLRGQHMMVTTLETARCVCCYVSGGNVSFEALGRRLVKCASTASACFRD
eukprot:4752251-Pleurochrysis_carterae.AAC.5